jgi:manganese transport protein
VEPIFKGDNIMMQTVVILSGVLLLGLLIYIIFHPYFSRKGINHNILMHKPPQVLNLEGQTFKKIAVALDFSPDDEKILSHAKLQGGKEATYFLIHIVESASATIMGKESDDYETRVDQEMLDNYLIQLKELGLEAKGALGYQRRVKEIVRLVQEYGADLLVIGAHGHTGLKDFVYGSTVDNVRHELKIPVLVVTI